jgi:hypothetical protein
VSVPTHSDLNLGISQFHTKYGSPFTAQCFHLALSLLHLAASIASQLVAANRPHHRSPRKPCNAKPHLAAMTLPSTSRPIQPAHAQRSSVMQCARMTEFLEAT